MTTNLTVCNNANREIDAELINIEGIPPSITNMNIPPCHNWTFSGYFVAQVNTEGNVIGNGLVSNETYVYGNNGWTNESCGCQQTTITNLTNQSLNITVTTYADGSLTKSTSSTTFPLAIRESKSVPIPDNAYYLLTMPNIPSSVVNIPIYTSSVYNINNNKSVTIRENTGFGGTFLEALPNTLLGSTANNPPETHSTLSPLFWVYFMVFFTIASILLLFIYNLNRNQRFT